MKQVIGGVRALRLKAYTPLPWQAFYEFGRLIRAGYEAALGAEVPERSSGSES